MQDADGSEQIIQEVVARKRKRKLRMLVGVLLFVGACLALLAWLLREPDYPSILRGATRVGVTFNQFHFYPNHSHWRGSGNGGEMLLSADPMEIHSWIAPEPWDKWDSGWFTHTEPADLYGEEIIFYTPHGTYRLGASEASMAILKNGSRKGRTLYVPPPGFWKTYQELLARVEAQCRSIGK